jgi:hypothetical protein
MPLSPYTATGIAEGWIETESEEEFQQAWQYLHDTGLAYQLQGMFGRTCCDMIDSGYLQE